MKLKAITDLHYFGPVEAGATFEAEDQWARVLLATGKAAIVGEKALQAEAPKEKPKRGYRRKDMQGVGETKGQ